ncbi:MAG: hypothetical protein AB7U82_11115 [Blastocatellales bacterium]
MKALYPDSPIISAKLSLPAPSGASFESKFSDNKPPYTAHTANAASGKISTQLSLWKTRIENSDAQSLWRSLHRLVSAHPLVRSALGYSYSSAHHTPSSSLSDLTQDLYLLLLQKGRFNHYIVSQMSDAEIEREIFQIELTNLLIGNLRRRRPENYRIARRVSAVLENDPRFRQFRQRDGQNARYRQAAEAVYGLSQWGHNKAVKDSGVFADLINHVPMRMRNRRRVGCTGDTQVIVSNQELVELIVEIFEAIDSPAPLRLLRQLALSKLPVCDPEMSSIDDEVNEERQGRNYDWIASPEANPEQIALMKEQEREARRAAPEFLNRLSLLARSNPQRTERLWRVLWHCFLDSDELSQLEIAEMVGLSDSSVSDYRRKIEAELRKLDFNPEQLRCFAEELDEQLQWRLSLLEGPDREKELDASSLWTKCDLASMVRLDHAHAF